MTPEEELVAMRRLAELEGIISSQEPSFMEKLGTNLKTGAQKVGAGLINLPLLPSRLVEAGVKKLEEKTGIKTPSFSDIGIPSFNPFGANYFDSVASEADAEGKKKGFKNPYGRTAVEALPGIALTPGLTTAPFAAVAANIVPPLGTEAVRKGFGDVAANIAGPILALGTGMALGPRLSAPEARVAKTVRGMSPEDFALAQRNLAITREGGAQTATLADVVPHGRLLELGNETRMNLPEGAFSELANRRPEDLLQLGRRAIEGAGTVARPEEATARAALLANNTIEQTRAGFSGQLQNSLDALPPIPQTRMNPLYDALQNYSRSPNVTLPFDAEAVRGAADALRSPNTPGLAVTPPPRLVRVTLPSGAVIRRTVQDPPTQLPGLLERPSDISLALTEWRRAQNPQLAAPGSKVVGERAASDATRLTNAAIDAEAPGYLNAKNAYRDAMVGVVNPMERGPLGQLAGPQLGNPNRVTRGQLDSVISELSPEGASGLINTLRTTDQANGPSNIGQQIASVLLQKRLNAGGTNPGQSVLGKPGFPKDENLSAILDASGINPRDVRAPLEAADLLQNFKGMPPGTNQAPNSILGALLRPFRHGDFALTKNMRDRYYQSVSEMLANPEQNLPRLQELAMFDPSVRRALSLVSAINANSQNPGEVK